MPGSARKAGKYVVRWTATANGQTVTKTTRLRVVAGHKRHRKAKRHSSAASGGSTTSGGPSEQTPPSPGSSGGDPPAPRHEPTGDPPAGGQGSAATAAPQTHDAKTQIVSGRHSRPHVHHGPKPAPVRAKPHARANGPSSAPKVLLVLLGAGGVLVGCRYCLNAGAVRS